MSLILLFTADIFFIFKSIELDRFYLPTPLMFDCVVLLYFMYIKIANISHYNFIHSIVKREGDSQQGISLSQDLLTNCYLILAWSVCAYTRKGVYMESHWTSIQSACKKVNWTFAVLLLTVGCQTLGNTKKTPALITKGDTVMNVKIKRASILSQLHLARYL